MDSKYEIQVFEAKKMQQLKYHEMINYFCDKFNYNSYLELGLRNPNDTFNYIRCEHKVSVDINPNCNPMYCMSTDEYFANLDKDVKFDIIFIDACHDKNFVHRDFKNSFKHLNEHGTIIMDDINPTSEYLLEQEWCGDAWEVFFELGKRSDLHIGTIMPSFTGFVRRGSQVPHNLVLHSSYLFLDENREQITKPIDFNKLDDIF
jgi:hypothetical protein